MTGELDGTTARVLAALRAATSQLDCRAWVVGGAVRDRLLGRPQPTGRFHADLDVVVEGGRGPALARRFAELAGAPPPVVFERFGTAHVTTDEAEVEFASARRESYAPDSRKPEVEQATLEEDLRRRDFTINTLTMDLEGRIEDRLGTGLRDLEARLLRTPTDPRETFADDPLRMLRGVRFGAQLGFELASELVPAMAELRDRLRPPVVSVERITDELTKMLVSPRPGWALEKLQEATLLEIVLPELAACAGVVQGRWHTHDVLGHTLGVVDGTPADIVTRLGAVFHDVGKPATAGSDGSFHGHERVSAEMTRTAMLRLRFPLALTSRVERLVSLHMRAVFYDPTWTDGAVRRLVVAAGDDIWRLVDLARADLGASAFPEKGLADELGARVRAVLTEAPSRMTLPVSGEDVMAALSLAPGKRVGAVKKRLQELVLEGRIEPTREAVLAFLKDHSTELISPPAEE